MNKERLLQVLVAPVISEKSTMAADQARQYVFKVVPDATKPEVRKAIEMLFDVKVEQVRMVNIKGKSKRFGAVMGRRNGVRKAYVRLAEGADIDFGGLA